ncbi:Hypothetical protein PHPALM_15336, partial [Phytophthora palmivora]
MMTVLPLADTTATTSKKRRRSIEPVDSSKILAMPLSMSPRAMASSPVRAALQQTAVKRESEELLRRSLMGLSLQLKLKMILVEAWASDMNSVVMERNLFSIAKELAILKEMGVY